MQRAYIISYTGYHMPPNDLRSCQPQTCSIHRRYIPSPRFRIDQSYPNTAHLSDHCGQADVEAEHGLYLLALRRQRRTSQACVCSLPR